MPAPVFVLASASPARLAILRGAGLNPVVRVSDVDEDVVAAALGPGTSPARIVTVLAEAKARAVANRLAAELASDCVVVGCDSMLLRAGVLQGKPHTAETARARWLAQAGTASELMTGHCVLRLLNGQVVQEASDCTSTTVHFSAITPPEIDAYIATGEPLQVAGGFTLDGLGGWFIDGIGGDPSSVIGIGLPLLRRLLLEVGISVTQLWAGAPRG